MAGNNQPLKGTPAQADIDRIYKNAGALESTVSDLQKKVDAIQSPTDQNPYSVLAPCVPAYVVDRIIVPGRGERIVGCVNFPSSAPTNELKTVIREYKHNGVTLQDEHKKIVDNYTDITDDQIRVGHVEYTVKEILDFDRVFALWQLKLTDNHGHFLKARDEASQVPLAIFRTGPPVMGPPAAHNWFRNGKHRRSKRNATPALIGTIGVEGQEDWAWFVNCDRGKAGIAAAKPVTTGSHATPSADPAWDKARGAIRWGITGTPKAFGQRLPHSKMLDANDLVYALTWIGRDVLTINPPNADLRISIVSQIDGRLAAADPILRTVLATILVPDIGSGGASFAEIAASIMSRLEDDLGAAAIAAAPNIQIDPDIEPATLITDPRPLQVHMQIAANYTPSTTPDPNNDSSGLWALYELIDKTGVGGFTVTRQRMGDGPGDYTDHPSELDDDVTGPAEVTTGISRPGGDDYGRDPNSLDPGRGVILRPRTD